MKSISSMKTAAAGSALAVFLAAGVLFVTIGGRAQGPTGLGIDQDEVQIGLNIAPVPLNYIGKDINLLGLGSFLVN
ncbi:MAG TPA: hypothetical protein VK419_11280, partial [Bryobacteraceae bacterium]|nr:hypothetical protein [Bryobacteraceae bacterium]